VSLRASASVEGEASFGQDDVSAHSVGVEGGGGSDVRLGD